ncbi:MAG: methyltransferase domain-containing protein [Actinobacteria bacterium]|nr:methyltransferase domain-containing protein [Actinomycetota bacterium]
MGLYDDEARYYDALYYWKDYEGEARRIEEIVDGRVPQAKTLLDVGCGTGMHMLMLRDRFAVTGLDLNDAMLEVARERLPGVTLHRGDMLDFDLGSRFDIITCLFSGIGYAPDVASLDRAVARMAAHLDPGGLLIVEPWLEPDDFAEGHLGALLADQPDFKLARLNTSHRDGRASRLDFVYALVSPDETKTWESSESLTLFERNEMLAAFERAGFEVEHDPTGLMGRGLYVAIRR